MTDALVLTLNAGSSSLKFAVFAPGSTPRRIHAGSIDRIASGTTDHERALDDALSHLDAFGGVARVIAVGHRIVHGGPGFDGPRRLTADVIAELRRLAPLDPDHLPAELAIVEAMRSRAPELAQVACFDTAFHRTLPDVARLLPIPRRYEALGMRRYGFHGLSYTFLVEELGRVAGERAARGRVVMAHLGSGASLVALRDGCSVETTMGFTPNSGIPMGTRSGDLDPGVIVHLLRAERISVDELDGLLNHQSGLFGISETSADMRDLLAHEATDGRAADAVAVFCHRTRQAIGALAATIGGLDTLVFSGGIGENAAPVRARVLRGLEHLGVGLDDARNAAGAAVISTDASACVVRVIRTDEESVIVRETLRTIGGESP
ncbi:MAG TPA: acetate/propionate family kinase [Polyangiaceae bacterium]